MGFVEVALKFFMLSPTKRYTIEIILYKYKKWTKAELLISIQKEWSCFEIVTYFTGQKFENAFVDF